MAKKKKKKKEELDEDYEGAPAAEVEDVAEEAMPSLRRPQEIGRAHV